MVALALEATRGNKPVTARTLLFRAAAAGWVRREDLGQDAQGPHGMAGRPGLTPQQLMVSTAHLHRAAAPMLSQLERADLLSILHRLKDAGTKISPNDLRKEMHRIAKLAFAPAETVKSAPESQLPGWAKGCCYVAGQDVFFFRQGDRRYAPDVLNNMYNVYLRAPRRQQLGQALNLRQGLPAQRHEYIPRLTSSPTTANAGLTFITDPVTNTRFVNTYRPTYPEPDEKGRLNSAL